MLVASISSHFSRCWLFLSFRPWIYSIRCFSLIVRHLPLSQNLTWMAVEHCQVKPHPCYWMRLLYSECGLNLAFYRGMKSPGFLQDTAKRNLKSFLLLFRKQACTVQSSCYPRSALSLDHWSVKLHLLKTPVFARYGQLVFGFFI